MTPGQLWWFYQGTWPQTDQSLVHNPWSAMTVVSGHMTTNRQISHRFITPGQLWWLYQGTWPQTDWSLVFNPRSAVMVTSGHMTTDRQISHWFITPSQLWWLHLGTWPQTDWSLFFNCRSAVMVTSGQMTTDRQICHRFLTPGQLWQLHQGTWPQTDRLVTGSWPPSQWWWLYQGTWPETGRSITGSFPPPPPPPPPSYDDYIRAHDLYQGTWLETDRLVTGFKPPVSNDGYIRAPDHRQTDQSLVHDPQSVMTVISGHLSRDRSVICFYPPVSYDYIRAPDHRQISHWFMTPSQLWQLYQGTCPQTDQSLVFTPQLAMIISDHLTTPVSYDSYIRAPVLRQTDQPLVHNSKPQVNHDCYIRIVLPRVAHL